MNERSSYYQDQVAKAKEIMQPFILRRLKNEVHIKVFFCFFKFFFLIRANNHVMLYM